MKIKRGQKLFILGLAIGFVFTWFIFQSARAANASETEVTLPADLSVDSVDDLLAGLSDEQVRSLLIKELKSEALRQAEEEAARSAGSLEQSATLLKRRARMVLSGIPILVPEMGRALHKLTQGRGLGRFILILLAALALVAGAWMVERLFRGRLAALRQQLGESEPETFSLRVRRIFLRALLDVFSLGVFFLAGFILFSFSFPNPVHCAYLQPGFSWP
jgi:hypothetical protein